MPRIMLRRRRRLAAAAASSEAPLNEMLALLVVGEIVGVTSDGYTSNCRYIDGYQRVEIGVVQDWLAHYI